MGLHVIGYYGHCYNANGSPCSGGPFWVFILIAGGAFLVSLLSHQGYRSSRGRSSIFGSMFGGRNSSYQEYRDEKAMQDANEQYREAELLKGVRDTYGVAPNMPGTGPPDPMGATPAAAVTPESAQAYAMADPVAMVDATGMEADYIKGGGGGSGGAVPTAATAVPAGWYADPELPGAMRYWSGASWSPSGVTPPGVSTPPHV
jgi:hypothetical protein